MKTHSTIHTLYCLLCSLTTSKRFRRHFQNGNGHNALRNLSEPINARSVNPRVFHPRWNVGTINRPTHLNRGLRNAGFQIATHHSHVDEAMPT